VVAAVGGDDVVGGLGAAVEPDHGGDLAIGPAEAVHDGALSGVPETQVDDEGVHASCPYVRVPEVLEASWCGGRIGSPDRTAFGRAVSSIAGRA